MNLSVGRPTRGLSVETQTLLDRMLSPLCGLDQRISFMLRPRSGPRLLTCGAGLTGLHVLVDQPAPEQDPYHVGGGGVLLEEATIRALAETIERYSQFVSEASGRLDVRFAAYSELAEAGERVVQPSALRFFGAEQYASPRSPFRPFSEDEPLGWIRARSLLRDELVWVPAQLLLIGYALREGERRLLAAVTTGTAAHRRRLLALRNALLELVQIDAAMGHWYSAANAPQIELDRRTPALRRLLDRHLEGAGDRTAFYWLRSADLPGLSVACIVAGDGGVPEHAVGLGSDLRLEQALYKALLEAAGVVQLARVLTVLHDAHVDGRGDGDRGAILDLNQNVVYFAAPGNGSFLRSKFGGSSVRATDLPADSPAGAASDVRRLVEGFRSTGKELVGLDLTTEDIRALGFSSCRVWSPDTLALCLPSLPPRHHPRFAAYGGAEHEHPHPYP